MDRQKISKAVYEIGLKNRIGTAQNLYAGTTQIRQAAAGAFTLTATIQAPCLLQTINVSSSNPNQFTISDITVAGQSVFTSNGVAVGSAFTPNAAPAGSFNRALGISVTNAMEVVVQGSTSATSNISLACGLDPLDASKVKSTAEQAYAYNFVHGLGTVNIPAEAAGVPGQATLSSVSNRQVILGMIQLGVLTAGIPNTDILVSSFKIDSLEMLNSSTGAQDITLEQFANLATTIRDNTLGYSLNPQSRVDITLKNWNAAGGGCDVSGAIFCEPWKK
jgi:hypothetical protein